MSAYVKCDACGRSYDNGERHACDSTDLAEYANDRLDAAEARIEVLEDLLLGVAGFLECEIPAFVLAQKIREALG